MSRYEVDKDFNLKKVTHSVGGMLVTSLKWLIATVSLAAFYYVFFSFLISTDEEKKLMDAVRTRNGNLSVQCGMVIADSMRL